MAEPYVQHVALADDDQHQGPSDSIVLPMSNLDGAVDGTKSALDSMLSALERFGDEVSARPNLGSKEAPLEDLKQLTALGLLVAPLPGRFGGLGLGTEPGRHLPLLRVLTLLGGADLVLGRLYEGHVNAIVLLASYGTEEQLERAALDAANGILFGVWNTGEREAVRLSSEGPNHTYSGSKTFASGAGIVRRPIVTAQLGDRGWQMTLPPMEAIQVAPHIKIDKGFWHPLGMEGSVSFAIDFTGASIATDGLVGEPGDFYRDPLFRGGAIRFAAVHAGAVIRLHRLFADWLQSRGRGNDPYQIARLGEIAIQAQASVLWVERAAAVAEQCLSVNAGKLETERMIETANMTRTAISQIAEAVMQRVAAGVGAHGLLQPARFEKLLRDLTIYLRQPAPDQALADVGRASLRKNNLRQGGTENFVWKQYLTDGSLPPRYFDQIYERSQDPWNFETSEYEREKYRSTLDVLPLAKYRYGLEIGSSIGVFTRLLADRCESLLSVDISDRALNAARARCSSLSNVRFQRAQIPQDLPSGRYDLIVVSEIAYYWSREVVEEAAGRIASLQAPGDHLVLVHLTTPVPDYPLTGDEVHDAWLARREWRGIRQERHEQYRIDVLERRSAR